MIIKVNGLNTAIKGQGLEGYIKADDTTVHCIHETKFSLK